MHFNTILKQVKSRRKDLQVTQAMLADLSGVSLRALKQFESGKGNPTLETLSKIAKALGMELNLQVKTPNFNP
jgi:transcriptional regulator with XRE-family HTH domain